MTFAKWLDTFVDEKGLDREQSFEVEGPVWGTNIMPLEVVLLACKEAESHHQKKIKETLVKIDFANGDVMHFFKHIAAGIAM
jgi:hypothetical protein